MTWYQTVWHYFQVAAPWLVASGIPSLITGLTAYPKASGVVKALKVLLNVFSVLSHFDSPGTFKAPLSMSKAPQSLLVLPEVK